MNENEYNSGSFRTQEELYKSKSEFLTKRDKTVRKVMSKGPDSERKLKWINLKFDPGKYKCNVNS